jgi:hypothetical protein
MDRASPRPGARLAVSLAVSLAGALLCVLAAACGSTGKDTSTGVVTAPGGEAVQGPKASVHGTVLDATSGVAVGGALVELEDGTSVETDPEGRFRVLGLAPGTEGPLRASHPDHGGARVTLRPLPAGSDLEVVLYLRHGG